MNMQALMQQAQKMQKEITKKKEEIDKNKFIGNSELVEAVVTGDRKLVSVEIKNKDSITVDDLEVLQDMIVIAVNDALGKAEEEISSVLGAYGGQFGGLL